MIAAYYERATLSVAVLLCSGLFAPTALADSFDGRWGAAIDFGVQAGNGRTIGQSSLFAPLWQDDRSLVFTDLRGMFDNRQAREGNFGIGFRHMLDSGWNLGTYGYFDIRRSAYGNTFHQATLGVEALGEIFDLRANVYLPFGDTERTAAATSSSTSHGAAAVVSGNQLSIQRTSTTTTSTVVEKAMRGVDAEVGMRLPVFPEEWNLDARVFAGAYSFEADGVGDIRGPRARLELSARDLAGLPGVRLGVGLTYQNDKVRGDQFIASARLTIPLNPQAGVNERQQTYMEQRMTEAVVRDVDIVTGSRAGSTTSTTRVDSSEAAINTWNDEVVTSLTHVDAADGAAALNTALAAGQGSLVVLNGDLHGITDRIVLGEQNTLLGGGTTLRLRGADSLVEVDYTAAGSAGSIIGDAPGTINLLDALVVVQSSSVLGGLYIEKTGAYSIVGAASVYVSNANNASIFKNNIVGGDDSYSHGVFVDFSPNTTIYGNKITTTNNSNTFGVFVGSGSSALIEANDIYADNFLSGMIYLSGSGQSRVLNNTLNPHSSGYVMIGSGGFFLPGSIGNTINGSYGTQCYAFGSSGTVSFTNAADCVF
ncbi:MAG: inverse autotransporter beta domain-containing protein [Shinella sp.]|uniref:inverse autotransporter beta domain-containing protein n=1 Tax=Shinella sp. TaxID=1870904 RepID=UPI003C75EAF8